MKNAILFTQTIFLDEVATLSMETQQGASVRVLTCGGQSPCHVVGDIHGQYYDLIALLDRFDTGIEPLLFLGDYVDRGYFGCEVVLYLFALKLAAPKVSVCTHIRTRALSFVAQRYYFLRGNHECRALTELYNFKKECTWKYGAALYAEIMLAFDALPLACVVTNQLNEVRVAYAAPSPPSPRFQRFFCVHGGISPYLMSLDEDVAVIDRFCEIPTDGPICDMVWSDPSRKADDESQVGACPSSHVRTDASCAHCRRTGWSSAGTRTTSAKSAGLSGGECSNRFWQRTSWRP